MHSRALKFEWLSIHLTHAHIQRRSEPNLKTEPEERPRNHMHARVEEKNK